MTIGESYQKIQEEIAEAAVTSGRKPEDVTFVAVTKFVTVEKIQEAVLAGACSVGENRVQELLSKLEFFEQSKLDVNLIGQLQTNKVKYIIGRVNLIQSMDRLELAREVDKRARAKQMVQKVLVEVNIGGEEQKGGVAVDKLPDFLGELSQLSGIKVKGLMCVPPAVEEREARAYFAKMQCLFQDSRRIPGVEMDVLSMGMSADYRAAILEGATMVRIGSALFGKRNYGVAPQQ